MSDNGLEMAWAEVMGDGSKPPEWAERLWQAAIDHIQEPMDECGHPEGCRYTQAMYAQTKVGDFPEASLRKFPHEELFAVRNSLVGKCLVCEALNLRKEKC